MDWPRAPAPSENGPLPTGRSGRTGGERSNLTSGGEADLTEKSKSVSRTVGAAVEGRKAMRFLKVKDLGRVTFQHSCESQMGFPILHSSRDANEMKIRFGGLLALA